MSKKKLQVPKGIEISEEWSSVNMLFLTAAVILIVPVMAQGQPPDWHEISGYVTYGGSGFSGVSAQTGYHRLS